MSVIEDILTIQLRNDEFYEHDNRCAGIAQLAVDRGYNTLTDAQQRVLSPFLSKHCSGYSDPATHYPCDAVLEGESLLAAYENSDFDSLQCESCRAEAAIIAYDRERFFRE
ncbi:hypothetical protein [Shewanella algae]|uniref:hypothetical protein n=1 Tax=Shewanella algae TaxID=38313 RepID=UPI0031F5D641